MKIYQFNRMVNRPTIVIWLLMAALIFVSSCATGPAFRKVELVPEGKSVAYFYRPARFFGGARSPAIFDNGKEILSGLTNGGYWVYFVDPGRHSFSTVADFLNSSNVTIDCKSPKEEYYIRMDMLQGLVAATAKLYRVYPEQAREEIVGCKLVE